LKEAHVAALIHDWEDGTPASLIALRMATIEGARALGMQNEIGTVEVGKKADIVLVDMDTPRFTPLNDIVHHLVYSALSRDVTTVIVDGKVIMQDRAIKTLDVKNILRQSRQRAARIHKSV
jgi:5-methylthioadenosine/S-adenosylhomocysteine deaminase